jgi:hypothetical protein
MRKTYKTLIGKLFSNLAKNQPALRIAHDYMSKKKGTNTLKSLILDEDELLDMYYLLKHFLYQTQETFWAVADVLCELGEVFEIFPYEKGFKRRKKK